MKYYCTTTTQHEGSNRKKRNCELWITKVFANLSPL